MLKAGLQLERKACQMLDEDQAVEGSMKLGREEAVGRVDVHINPNPTKGPGQDGGEDHNQHHHGLEEPEQNLDLSQELNPEHFSSPYTHWS